MKALLSAALVGLMGLQVSCTSSSMSSSISPLSSKTAIAAKANSAKTLATPEVAVLPTSQGVLIAWKPIDEADGYFVYRETSSPPTRDLLGIGPRDAQGFIDRHPPQDAATYIVQAFKVSEPSDKANAQTGAAPTTMPSEKKGPSDTDMPLLPHAKMLHVIGTARSQDSQGEI